MEVSSRDNLLGFMTILVLDGDTLACRGPLPSFSRMILPKVLTRAQTDDHQFLLVDNVGIYHLKALLGKFVMLIIEEISVIPMIFPAIILLGTEEFHVHEGFSMMNYVIFLTSLVM